jgi:hypothetical protein
MAQVTDWLDDFSGGVNMFLPKNKIGKNSFPLAVNTALIPAESGGVGIGKRPGFSLKGLLKKKQNVVLNESSSQVSFRLYDVDRNGQVEPQELIKILSAMVS